MALIKAAVRLLLREHKRYEFKGPVLALGVPEVYASHAELSAWFPAETGRPCPVPASEAKLTTSHVGLPLGWVDAGTLFRMLGLEEVVSIDIEGSEYAAQSEHDLNNPLPATFLDRFQLVVDPGTTEHVFDVKTALGNVVRALKVGGVVVHQVPVYSYNGGYFSINPSVLIDFYRVNGFEEIHSYIIMWDRYWAYTGSSRVYEYSSDLLAARHALADADQCRFCPMLLFFARKARALPEIVVPLQHDGNSEEARNAVAPRPVSNDLTGTALRQARRALYGVLPWDWANALDTRARRWLQLRRSHQRSFWL